MRGSPRVNSSPKRNMPSRVSLNVIGVWAQCFTTPIYAGPYAQACVSPEGCGIDGVMNNGFAGRGRDFQDIPLDLCFHLNQSE